MPSIIRSVLRNPKLVPAIFLAGSLGLIVLVNRQVSKSSEAAAAINLAGRQRMLNQRYTREVVDSAHGGSGDFRKTLDLQRRSLTMLRNGGQHEFGPIPVAEDPQLQSILASHEAELDRQESLTNVLLNAPPEESTRT